jgi:uroporphyrinogen-III synthase
LLGLRSARAALKKSAPNHGVHSASIGPVTSATLREFRLPIDIEAKNFDIPGLIDAILAAKERIAKAKK